MIKSMTEPLPGGQERAWRNKKYFLTAAKAALSAAVFYYLLRKIDLAVVGRALFSAEPLYVVPALLLALAMRFLTAYQSSLLLAGQGIVLPALQVFAINMGAAFYNLFVPGDLSGSAVKWYKLAQKSGRKARSLLVVVAARFINTLMVVVIGLFCLFLSNPFTPSFSHYAPLVLFAPLTALLLSLLRPSLSFSFLDFSRRERLSPRWRERMERLNGMLGDMGRLPSHRRLMLLGIALLVQALGIAAHYLLARSLDIKLSLAALAWVRSLALLVQILPVSLSGLGVREGVVVFLFGRYGVPAGPALAFSLLLFALSVVIALCGGVCEACGFWGVKSGAGGAR